MSKAANFCNHKRTSHMTQLTPWRYLEKATHRMGRVTERQEQHRMKVGRGEGGGGGGRKGRYTGQGCKKEDI